MIDKNLANNLYHKGYSLKKIGDKFGVSKQRIDQVIDKKKYTIKHKKINSNPAEIWTTQQLINLGFFVEILPYASPFDLIVNKKIRVEVKHIKNTSVGTLIQNRRYNTIRIHNRKNIDILIIIQGDIKNNPTCYIIPPPFPFLMTIPIEPKIQTKKQRVYKNNWRLFFTLTI